MAYMDNPQTFSKRAHRVIPAYADLLSDYLGMGQIVLAFLTLVISIIGFVIKSYTAAAASGVLLAIPLFTCGVLGVIAGVRKETWAILGYLIFSILSFILCIVLLGSSVVGVAIEYQRDSPVSVSVREGVDIALLAFSMLAGASVTLSFIITGKHILHGCCKCVQGAQYVEEPNVQFSNPTSTETINSRSNENAGYDQPNESETSIQIATVTHIPGPQANQNLAAANGQHFSNPLADSSTS